jgi:hypothetical protein
MKRPLKMTLLFLIALSAPALAQSHMFFPQIASGGGWSTDLYFTNQATVAVSGIKIGFYDDAGAAMILDSNLGTGSSYVFDLAKGGSQAIRIAPSSVARVGYAEVTYPSNAFVRANEVYRFKPEGTVLAEVGVSQRAVSNNFSFPVEINLSKNLNTAIGLVNPPEVDAVQVVVLNLIDLNGQVQATATKLLEKGQHFAEYLPQTLFPNQDNFTGSISVSSPIGVALMALRQDNETFGGISSDFGPILGPFMTNGYIVNEIEPNDEPSQAQAISGTVRIAGNIRSSDDADLYTFTGIQGEIVSVLCEAQSIGSPSSMDPVVMIYNSKLELIAINDDSGLSGTGDCFLQIALPAYGKYYIVVENYYANSGPDYLYQLHIKLPQ